jgi:hypothetical protein
MVLAVTAIDFIEVDLPGWFAYEVAQNSYSTITVSGCLYPANFSPTSWLTSDGTFALSNRCETPIDGSACFYADELLPFQYDTGEGDHHPERTTDSGFCLPVLRESDGHLQGLALTRVPGTKCDF